MAALTHPHWHVITPGLRDLLQFLGQQTFLRRFYLAGGTALALQLGHRLSVDLDFFSETDEVSARTRSEIMQALKPLAIQVIENVDGNLLMLARGIHLGFFSYGYPLLEDTPEVENVRLASSVDIGLMKCDALITRGSRKDFYDLYFLTRQIPLDQLLISGERKYAYYRDFPLAVIERMVDFENADRDVQPSLFEAVAWKNVKDFFRQEAARLARTWLQS